MLQCMSLLLALNGHSNRAGVCPLLEQERTLASPDAELLGRE